MDSVRAIQLPAELIRTEHDSRPVSATGTAPFGQMGATALALVALCVAVAFTLPV